MCATSDSRWRTCVSIAVDQAHRLHRRGDLHDPARLVDVGAGPVHQVGHADREPEQRIVPEALEPMGLRTHPDHAPRPSRPTSARHTGRGPSTRGCAGPEARCAVRAIGDASVLLGMRRCAGGHRGRPSSSAVAGLVRHPTGAGVHMGGGGEETMRLRWMLWHRLRVPMMSGSELERRTQPLERGPAVMWRVVRRSLRWAFA